MVVPLQSAHGEGGWLREGVCVFLLVELKYLQIFRQVGQVDCFGAECSCADADYACSRAELQYVLALQQIECGLFVFVPVVDHGQRAVPDSAGVAECQVLADGHFYRVDLDYSVNHSNCQIFTKRHII